MLARYGISPKRSASLLDTFSCIFQGIIPYSAQMLVAISTYAALGYAISAFDIIPLLFYPFLLWLSSLLFILFDKELCVSFRVLTARAHLLKKVGSRRNASAIPV